MQGSDQLTVFIGWDPREQEAFEVCAHSLSRRSSIPLSIVALRQDELRERGFYWRPVDQLASTEFTFTRFLVPALMGYQGWAIFCDCDFLWLADIGELFALRDRTKAVHVVQHDYQPSAQTKMDGRTQHLYPRKNWSSLVLWNCAHPKHARLSSQTVNTVEASYLHRFQWLEDREIGALSHEWNWLVGWYAKNSALAPKAIHFTEGGPWFSNCRDVEFSDLWLRERDGMPMVANL